MTSPEPSSKTNNNKQRLWIAVNASRWWAWLFLALMGERVVWFRCRVGMGVVGWGALPLARESAKGGARNSLLMQERI